MMLSFVIVLASMTYTSFCTVIFFLIIRQPPRSTRTDPLFPSRRSSDLGAWLIMAARALGLDAGPMSGFDNAGVDAAFFAGTAIKSNFITTLGFGDPRSEEHTSELQSLMLI